MLTPVLVNARIAHLLVLLPRPSTQTHANASVPTVELIAVPSGLSTQAPANAFATISTQVALPQQSLIPISVLVNAQMLDQAVVLFKASTPTRAHVNASMFSIAEPSRVSTHLPVNVYATISPL